MHRLLTFLLLVAIPLSEQVARFDNYKVYRLTPENEEQIKILQELENMGVYDFWSFGKIGKPVDVMVPPHLDDDFEQIVKSADIKSSIFIEDVQKKIDSDNAPSTRSLFDWNNYHRTDTIYAWMRTMAVLFPRNVQLINGGRTFEGREILGVYVTFSTANANRGVFLEGGIHAREWISPATVTYILNELLTSTDTAVRAMAETHDWYIFPVTNPDGYEFTHSNNRLWRKTRSRNSILCYGADPNRNWEFQWNNGGVSNNPCSDTYAGSAAFSEIETRTLSAYIGTIAHRLKAYLSFHSFSQLLLLPYGVTGIGRPENFDTLMKIGTDAAAALSRRYGTQYTVGNIVDVLYTASGSSLDWVKGVHNVNLTYVYELRDTGSHGFILPANQIIPTAIETLDSLFVILRN